VHFGGRSAPATASQNVQIIPARVLGARVLATAGPSAKCEACIAAGAGLAINYREEEFAERILSHIGGEGIDVVLDIVAGPTCVPPL
jgi:NADPH:quinone reductase-like Zn-dependent oxidoreductase